MELNKAQNDALFKGYHSTNSYSPHYTTGINPHANGSALWHLFEAGRAIRVAQVQRENAAAW